MNYSTQLDTIKAELKEVKDSKRALEVDYQQMKVSLATLLEHMTVLLLLHYYYYNFQTSTV